jgi:hypothetical protein
MLCAMPPWVVKAREEVRVQERDNKTSLSLYVKLMVIFDKIS